MEGEVRLVHSTKWAAVHKVHETSGRVEGAPADGKYLEPEEWAAVFDGTETMFETEKFLCEVQPSESEPRAKMPTPSVATANQPVTKKYKKPEFVPRGRNPLGNCSTVQLNARRPRNVVYGDLQDPGVGGCGGMKGHCSVHDNGFSSRQQGNTYGDERHPDMYPRGSLGANGPSPPLPPGGDEFGLSNGLETKAKVASWFSDCPTEINEGGAGEGEYEHEEPFGHRHAASPYQEWGSGNESREASKRFGDVSFDSDRELGYSRRRIDDGTHAEDETSLNYHSPNSGQRWAEGGRHFLQYGSSRQDGGIFEQGHTVQQADPAIDFELQARNDSRQQHHESEVDHSELRPVNDYNQQEGGGEHISKQHWHHGETVQPVEFENLSHQPQKGMAEYEVEPYTAKGTDQYVCECGVVGNSDQCWVCGAERPPRLGSLHREQLATSNHEPGSSPPSHSPEEKPATGGTVAASPPTAFWSHEDDGNDGLLDELLGNDDVGGFQAAAGDYQAPLRPPSPLNERSLPPVAATGKPAFSLATADDNSSESDTAE